MMSWVAVFKVNGYGLDDRGKIDCHFPYYVSRSIQPNMGYFHGWNMQM
jgi:hypothetical protein